MACAHLLELTKGNPSLAVFQALDSHESYSYRVSPIGIVSTFFSSKYLPLQEYKYLNSDQKEYLDKLSNSILEQR